jgi:aromatic ring hydroxylase
MTLDQHPNEMYKIKNIMYNYSGGQTMKIPATELKQNLSKYLKLSATEPIFITKHGRVVAVLSLPNIVQSQVVAISATYGLLAGSPEMSAQEIQAARLKKYENLD